MLFIQTALHCEAREFIRAWRLKRDLAWTEYEVFAASNVTLCISGIGKLRAAAAVSAVLSRFPAQRRPAAAINIGIAGAHSSVPLGSVFYVNKVTDAGSRRRYYPDCIVEHGLAEMELETVEAPQRRAQENRLYDMEASGFFEAARPFLGSCRLFSVKLVSDHCADGTLDETYVERLFSEYSCAILTAIENIRSFTAARSGAEVFDAEDETLLAKLRDRHRFSACQMDILRDHARSFKIRTGQSLSLLAGVTDAGTQSKHDGKRLFRKFEQLLTQA